VRVDATIHVLSTLVVEYLAHFSWLTLSPGAWLGWCRAPRTRCRHAGEAHERLCEWERGYPRSP
jgi:hypothetical protein